MKTKKQTQNRLAKEKSPYLLQHADNPVDWYPWGEEAFNKAKKEDKPIFLSIGYSTCHWCHVMEHESFENPEIAEMMNDYFVAIKVDREERPDIDNIYMKAVTTMTGSGGWPLTAILTPDKKPFFGGTYFPPEEKWGTPGLKTIMEGVHSEWTKNRQKVLEASTSLTEILKQTVPSGVQKNELTEIVFTTAFNQFAQRYDSQFGGFGRAPKFPTGHNLSFLLRYWKRADSAKALEMVEHTLVQMARGGMYDHVGGGFHRYSTDREWQVPHFEKMLYDQAILSKTYLEAYQITKKESYAEIAREIFHYVLRDLKDDQGAFYSAEDADSLDPDVYAQMTPDPGQPLEKKEGAFYLWREDEIKKILDKRDVEIFSYYANIQPDGNARTDPHGEFVKKNIIYNARDLQETAKKFKKSPEEIQTILKRSFEKLFKVREGRPRPHLDDKILVDWNGLMISSLAFGAKVLDEPRYQEAAKNAADFILNNLISPEGRLLHRYRDKEAGILGSIEDYAFFVHGLLDLYEATFEVKYLKKAHQLTEEMLRLFWDEKDGGFHFVGHDAEKLLFRQKEIYDGAIPSGNSVAALDLVRLFHFTFDKKWREKYEDLFGAFSSEVTPSASAYSQFLIAFDFAFGPSQEIVIAGSRNDAKTKQMHKEIYDHFIPNKVVLWRTDEEDEAQEIITLAPYTKNQLPIEDTSTAYLCINQMCKLPTNDVNQFRQQLIEASEF